MFVKLAVIACVVVAAASQGYNGPLAGGLPAAQYPAGISPQACPNYPNCANPAVAVSPNAAPQQYSAQPQQYAPQPQQYAAQPQYQQAQYQQPQYQQAQPAPVSQYNPVFASQYAPAQQQRSQYSADVQNALNRGEYIGDGDYRGEGLAESGALGQAPVQQAYNPVAYQAAPAPQALPQGVGQPAQIPAGVDARACPNYPYCH